MKIIFTKNAARMCHNMVALVSRICQKGSMATSSGQKTSSQSSDHLSVILERYSAICCLQQTNKGYRSLPWFIGGKDVLASLPTGNGKSFCFALLPCHDEKTINGILHKFYVNVNYIPTCLRRQLLNSAVTTRCTQCYQTPFSRAF